MTPGMSVQPAGVADQLAFLQPAGMHEKVVLDAGEGDREIVLAELGAGLGIGQQRDGLAFPQAPGDGRLELRLAVVAGQPLAVGGHHVAALGLGDRRQEALPFVGEHFRHAELIVPVELGPGQRVDAAHHQLADPLRMRLGIGQRQRRAPRAAEHQPFVEAGHLAQPLDVGDQMPGRVGVEAGMRRRLAAAALVEQDDDRRASDRTAAGVLARSCRPARHAGTPPACAPFVPTRSQ